MKTKLTNLIILSTVTFFSTVSCFSLPASAKPYSSEILPLQELSSTLPIRRDNFKKNLLIHLAISLIGLSLIVRADDRFK